MGKKRKAADTKVAKAAEESPVKKSPPVGSKRKKESGSVTQRLHYPDSDCESGVTSFPGVTLKCIDSLSKC